MGVATWKVPGGSSQGIQSLGDWEFGQAFAHTTGVEIFGKEKANSEGRR